MRAMYDSLDSMPFNCYFVGTIAELVEFINNGIHFKDEYQHEDI